MSTTRITMEHGHLLNKPLWQVLQLSIKVNPSVVVNFQRKAQNHTVACTGQGHRFSANLPALRLLRKSILPIPLLLGLIGTSTPLWAKQEFRQSSRPEMVVANCPSVSFFEFIYAFADDLGIQRQHTQLHTPVATGMHSFAMQKMDYSAKNQSALMPTPVIPLGPQRKAQGMSLRIDDVTDNQAVVVMTSTYTSERVVYQFQKEGCWNLVSINKGSL